MGLVNWALVEAKSKGFTPLITPEIVRSPVVEKCGFQPRGQNTQVCLVTSDHVNMRSIFHVCLMLECFHCYWFIVF